MVFSLLVRFIHWGIALAVFCNLFITEDGEYIHRLLGYFAVSLVIARFIHGFLAKGHRHYPNKMAKATYFAMWFCLLGLGVSGFLMGTDQFWGDENVEEAHEFLANSLQVLIMAHLLGIALDSFKSKRRTWFNMINGQKN